MELKGDWNDIKGRLRKQYASLTDKDVFFEKGKQDEMLDRIQQKLGVSKEEIQKLIAEI